MSREYLNGKWCVRCGKKDPTPYLRDNWELFIKHYANHPVASVINVVDIGCGNGRNSEFMKKKGFSVISIDMVNDYGIPCIMGQQELPLFPYSIDVILANYSLMFLDKKERKKVISNLKLAARHQCTLMVELYEAKDSFAPDKKSMLALQKTIFDAFGWDKVKYSQGKFIARKQGEHIK